MSAPIIAFPSNQGRVGKTTLVYHLSWMYVELGLRVLAVDLDPQANLTVGLLNMDRLKELWPRGDHPSTIFGCIQPLIPTIMLSIFSRLMPSTVSPVIPRVIAPLLR